MSQIFGPFGLNFACSGLTYCARTSSYIYVLLGVGIFLEKKVFDFEYRTPRNRSMVQRRKR